MATTLRYMDQLLAAYPDNTAGLISAEAGRDSIASQKPGLGYLTSETDIVIPIESNTWVAINPLLLNPTLSPELWMFDGNNLAVSNYASLPGVTIPAGYSKVLSLTTLMVLDKAGGGTDAFEFQYTRNGVGFGYIEPITFAGEPQLETLITDTLADISVGDTYGVQVRGVNTGDDFDLLSFSMQLRDTYLATDPGGSP